MLLLQHFTKQCTKCNTLKHFIEYGKEAKGKYGLQSKCKVCSKIIHEQYRNNNREKCREAVRLWTANNKDKITKKNKLYRLNNLEKEKQKTKKWYEKNKDYNKEYYKKNKDKIDEQNKNWAKTIFGKMSKLNTGHKRRAKIKTGSVTTAQILELRSAKICYWCNTSLKNKVIHLDHYVALSKGGEHTFSNLVASCDECNQNKNAKDPLAFAQSIGKLF